MLLNDAADTHAAANAYRTTHIPRAMRGWRRLVADEQAASAVSIAGWRVSETTWQEWERLERDYITDVLTPIWLAGMKAGGRTLDVGLARARGKSWDNTQHYTPTSIYASKWIKERSGLLIVEWGKMTRDLMAEVIKQGLFEGLTYYYLGERIKDAIGLTTRQYQWLDNRYRRTYNALLLTGVGPEQATKIATRDLKSHTYFLKQYRAQMIARTETQAAFNQGQLAAMQEARDNGWIAHTVKVWSAAGGEPCEDCQELDGTALELDDKFQHNAKFSDEYTSGLTPPLHPNCMCVLTYETRE